MAQQTKGEAKAGSAHSPGPWKRGEEHECKIEIEDGSGSLVATVHGRMLLLGGGAMEANAALIAAAPEMLEALEAAASIDDEMPCFCSAGFRCSACKAIGQVRAAIAKATRSPGTEGGRP